MPVKYAPGWPGCVPRWTSSAKSGVGTAISPTSRVWFTLGHGIVNEVYYPRMDCACTRDMGVIVTDGSEFFSEEKRHSKHEVHCRERGIPAYSVANTCEHGRYRIEKEIVTDPRRDVLLQRTRFTPLKGKMEDYRLYVLIAPHLGNQGYGNTAYAGDIKGEPMLLAEREGYALALSCSAPWLKRSAGFVGASDGWQDLAQNKLMTWSYDRAENGNVALVGEVDLAASGGAFVLALGFGSRTYEAGHHARASLLEGFDQALEEYSAGWREWQKSLADPPFGQDDSDERYRISTSVLRTHEGKEFDGGLVASLSVPWGSSKGDNDLGGYHLVWSRDLVETAGGLLAAGAKGDVKRVLAYLRVVQESDGCWPQNMWLDGTPYWGGVQMDETGFPILLAAAAHREGVLSDQEIADMWPMVRRAAGFIVRNGPVSQQDRWEEEPGYSPFTLAVEITSLLAAADMGDLVKEPDAAAYLRETADAWNSCIEKWTYATGTDLARRVGVEGYYVRIAPPETSEVSSPLQGFVSIKNRPPGSTSAAATEIVSPDALALVRFGLRAPDDPRIVNTVKVIDAFLKVDTPHGPTWHRYNDDGYGEHSDGSPFDGTGIGRGWPLLVGERAHYELAAGRKDEAGRLLKAMEAFANEGGLIPEQVWDSPDIPKRGLYFGRPSGSAMPLVWAHAEHVKLRRSLKEGRVFDTPQQPVQRYLVDGTESRHAVWQFNNKSRAIQAGKVLRVEVLAPARVRWTDDEWRTAHDSDAKDTGLGVYILDLPTDKLPAGKAVAFTFYWTDAGRWEGADFTVSIGEG